MLTPALDPLFIAYNTGVDGGILRTMCIVRKYFTQETASNLVFGSFLVKNYSKERFKGQLRVNFCRRAAGTPAVLGMAVGVLIMVLHQTHIDQEHAKAPEARLARDLATIGASLGYEVSPDGRSITLQVFPGQTWKVRSAQTDQHGTGTITLYDPTR